MSKNGTKPKKGKPQKLIIPKGTLDYNDTAVIEIPPEYRNEDIVIAKKSNISRYPSNIDQSIGTNSSHRTIYQPVPHFDRPNETACQTPFDERDIEKLLEDLEAYYNAQKNFLIKSSTLLRRNMESCQNQQKSNVCGCSQAASSTSTSCTPTTFLLKKDCLQENASGCSFESFRPHRTPEPEPYNSRSWGGNESFGINTCGTCNELKSSMSRNITQCSTNPSNQHSFINTCSSRPANESFRSQTGNYAWQDTGTSDPNYALFREGVSKNMDSSKRNYKPLLNSKALFAKKAEELRLRLKELNKNDTDDYYDDLLNSKDIFAEKAESLRHILKHFDSNPFCIDSSSQEMMNTVYSK